MLDVSLMPDLIVTLLPQRAIYWAAERTLFVADLHVGKADVFQRAGIPIPAAVTEADLTRLTQLLAATCARRLIILGDFFHASGSCSPGVLTTLVSWRAAHAALEILLIKGNHDLHAGPPPAELDITPCGEAVSVGPFQCIHAPQAEPASYTLCGHLHPVAILREPNGARSLRLPCFHVSPRQLILPAFSTFTGGKSIGVRPGERIFVTTGEQIFEGPQR